jgi:hypothetical protein
MDVGKSKRCVLSTGRLIGNKNPRLTLEAPTGSSQSGNKNNFVHECTVHVTSWQD